MQQKDSEKDSEQQGTEDSKKSDPKNVDDSNTSVSTSSPIDTPKSQGSSLDVSTEKKPKQKVPPISGPPLPAPPAPPAPPAVAEVEEQSKPANSRPAYDSAGDSSDSPVEDWEELYSSDDMTRKPRSTPQKVPAHWDDYDTEEEKMPDPWNAIGIIGIRVYSKDEGLELRTVMEGGELLEGGMGEKGAADLDDAQTNAAGVRTEGKDGDTTKSPLTLR